MAEEKVKMSEEKEPKDAPKEPDKNRPEEEKKAAPEKAPAAPGAAFRLAAMAFAGLAVLAWAAAGYSLEAWISFLAKPIGPVKMSILPAALLGAAAGWLFFVKLKSQMDYTKPGQGTWVRMTGYVTALLLGAFGAVQLARAIWGLELPVFTVLGIIVRPRTGWFGGAAFGLSLVIGYHLWANKPRWSDFLIETQSELKKVSWPPNREWIMSSLVVVVVVVVVSVFLWGADWVLSWLMKYLGIGF